MLWKEQINRFSLNTWGNTCTVTKKKNWQRVYHEWSWFIQTLFSQKYIFSNLYNPFSPSLLSSPLTQFVLKRKTECSTLNIGWILFTSMGIELGQRVGFSTNLWSTCALNHNGWSQYTANINREGSKGTLINSKIERNARDSPGSCEITHFYQQPIGLSLKQTSF